MRIRWTTRIATAAGAICLIAGVAAGGPAHAAQNRPTAPAPDATVPDATGYVTGGDLTGVAALSASSAWAVGATGTAFTSRTLILHWNGKAWAKSPGFTAVPGVLNAVAVVSATSAWAVGWTGSATSPGSQRTLLMHWNGSKWAAVTTPKPVSGSFGAVTATAKYAFAAGSAGSATLIWFWNGKTWARTSAPAIPGEGSIDGIAAASATSAWAGGLATVTGQISDALLHWNGKKWSLSGSFPIHGVYQWINGMAEGAKGTAWAVGSNSSGTGPGPISMYFNGKTWVKASGPAAGGFNGVTAVPGGTAWAVGANAGSGPASSTTLIAKWTGKGWAKVTSPTPKGGASLAAVAATSTSGAWAVGSTAIGSVDDTPKTLILHWNGKTWS